jgi:hypothetical protein
MRWSCEKDGPVPTLAFIVAMAAVIVGGLLRAHPAVTLTIIWARPPRSSASCWC